MPIHEGVFITCAVTGSGLTAHKSGQVPVAPERIAADCLEAAEAGAAIVHIHVRDPETGLPSREVDLYEDVVERIRASETDVIVNLTTGMGGDLTLGPPERPLPPAEEGTDLVGVSERLEHIERIRPEICTLDCGSMNFGDGDYIMSNTTNALEMMAERITALGVRPEIEVFDTGHLAHAKHLADLGLLRDPVMVQLCMGIPWGAPDDLHTFLAMRNNVPDNWTFSAFSLGRNQLRYVTLAALAGGNARVGLEDNIYLERGVLATNRELVERAAALLKTQNYRILGPAEVRENLQLTA